MKKLKLVLASWVLVSGLNAYEYEYKKCEPCKSGKIIGATGGGVVGGSIAYSACVAAAIAAGVLTEGVGFVAGMEVCSGATIMGTATGVGIGGSAGDVVDNIRDCCE